MAGCGGGCFLVVICYGEPDLRCYGKLLAGRDFWHVDDEIDQVLVLPSDLTVLLLALPWCICTAWPGLFLPVSVSPSPSLPHHLSLSFFLVSRSASTPLSIHGVRDCSLHRAEWPIGDVEAAEGSERCCSCSLRIVGRFFPPPPAPGSPPAYASFAGLLFSPVPCVFFLFCASFPLGFGLSGSGLSRH